MLRANFPKSLEAGLNAVWMASEKMYPLDWTKLFEEKTSNKAFEEQVLRAGLGIAPIKSEGAAVAEDAGGEFWTSRYVHVTTALKFALTQEALEDNLYKDLGATYTQELMRAIRETEEIMAANVLNTATSTNGGDGTTLLSTSHPLWGGGTYANKLSEAADLSESSLEDVLVMISNATNDRGLPMVLNPKRLVFGNANMFNAHRILNSVQRVGTPDNDTNAIRSMGVFSGEPIAVRRMTDTDMWFVLTDATMGLQFFRRKALQKGGQEDFNTGNFEYKARTRFSVGYTNPRCLYGSEGA
jgi:hypothetical protein